MANENEDKIYNMTIISKDIQKQADNDNRTNIQKADEIAGFLGNLGLLARGTSAPYISFLLSQPAALTGVSSLVDKIGDGTAIKNDYVNAITSLGGAAISIASLVRVGLGLSPLGLTVSLGLAVLNYANSKDYDLSAMKDDIVNSALSAYDKLFEEYKIEKNISTEHKELGFEDTFLSKFEQSKIETKLEDIKKQLQDYLEKLPNQETKAKIQLTEQEIKDEVDRRVQEYIHENGITSLKDIVQFTNKTREEIQNETIKIESKEQFEKVQEQEIQNEDNSGHIYKQGR